MSALQPWLRRGTGILSVGGGAIGFSSCLAMLVGSVGVVSFFLLIAFMFLYAYGIFTGVRLLEGDQRSVALNKLYWGIQVPACSTHLLSYVFTSGFHVTAWFNLLDNRVSANFLVGSRFNFGLLQTSTEPYVGVNIFALFVVILLSFSIDQKPDQNRATEIEPHL